jgi:hypothetical protein
MNLMGMRQARLLPLGDQLDTGGQWVFGDDMAFQQRTGRGLMMVRACSRMPITRGRNDVQ